MEEKIKDFDQWLWSEMQEADGIDNEMTRHLRYVIDEFEKRFGLSKPCCFRALKR